MMAGLVRITNTPPPIDIDGSMWTVFVRDKGCDAQVSIQVCDGVDMDGVPHGFAGDYHEGCFHFHLDSANSFRLLCQLRGAFTEPSNTQQ